MKHLGNLEELMVAQMRTLYLGEAYIQNLVDEFDANITDSTLKGLLKTYGVEISDQVIILKRIFNILFEQKRGGDCTAIKSLTDVARLERDKARGSEMKDALIVLSLQHIIHYKIVLLGAICTYGKLMGHYEEVATLHQELDREKRMDRKLAMIAEAIVDVKVPKNYLIS